MRLKKPDCVAQIHRTGKVLIMGAKQENLAYLGARRIARVIQKIDFPIRLSSFRIHNVMCDVRFGFCVNLDKIESDWSEFCRYNPDISQQLYFRLEQFKITLIIYPMGKITTTGANSFKDNEEAIRWITPIIVGAKKSKLT